MQTYYAQLSRAVGTKGQGGQQNLRRLQEKFKKVNNRNELHKNMLPDV